MRQRQVLVCDGDGRLAEVLRGVVQAHGWRLSDALRAALPLSPFEYARRLYYDTLLYDPRSIRYLRDLMGPDRLVVGSDYPFNVAEKPPGRALVCPAERRQEACPSERHQAHSVGHPLQEDQA